MPVTKTAKRALRVSSKKEKVNSKIRANMESKFRIAQKSGAKKDLSAAYSAIDTASKKNVIHANKAARLKSQLAKPKK